MPGAPVRQVKLFPGVISVTFHTAGGNLGCRTNAREPMPSGPLSSRRMLRTDSVHSCHRSASDMTAHTVSVGALMSTVIWQSIESIMHQSRSHSRVASTGDALRILGQPIEREQRDVVPGPAVEREVREDFADNAAELIAVTGEACRDEHAWFVWQRVDDEVLVGRVREQTGLERDGRPVGVRKIALERAPQHCLVCVGADPIDAIGIDDLTSMMVLADLDAVIPVLRNAVKASLIAMQVEHRKSIGLEQFGHSRPHPEDHLAFD